MSEQSRERNNRAQTGTYCTILWASIGRNVGHPPAFPLCLTLNLAAGMRKGRRQRRRRRHVWRGVRQTETTGGKLKMEPGAGD